jgi:uncharacterized protein with beta-barrel porin domain
VKQPNFRFYPALLLIGLCLAPAARAQNATWNGVTSNFNTAGNWSPNTAVPAGTASFGGAGLANLTFSANANIGGFTFNPGAQAYTFDIASVAAGPIFTGAGIVNNSSNAPTFNVGNGGGVAASSGLTFTNAATAGNAVITNTNGGVTGFLNTSTAGNAIITNSGGTALFSGTLFVNSSTAGNATITTNTGGITQFNQSSTAGNATIVNSGGSTASFNIRSFINALTNPDAVPSANEVGVAAFLNTSTAGNATIINYKAGVTAFLNTSTAGAATITTNRGGITFFTEASSGGTASLITNAGGTLDLSAHALGSMAAGSIQQAAGSFYQIGVTAAGQSNSLGVSGTATLQGGTVQLVPAPGNYGRSPTYTIVNATGGVNGTFASASSFVFLTPTLSYDPNNVFLTVSQSFAGGGQTANQRAVGSALDQASASASGDFNTVIGTLAVLGATQGPLALNAISGQPYADFGTLNVQSGVLFMNAVAQQMAVARGSATGGGQRQALAQACEIASCDGTSPWGTWASALGGLGNVAGNGNASTLTYNFGGGAAGVDYRLDPRFLVGLGAGYAAGNQWVDSFVGRGWTDSVSVMAYGSFTQAGFYADALAGYAWSGNQMQRQILIAGPQPRTANGSTGANQFLGQVETGYRLPVFAPASASVTPFARLQGSTVNQNAFSEWGANALSLNVAQQTTNSLRTTFGADLAGAIGLSGERKLDLALRLGWLHDYADTGRPITAAFAGAPTTSFTVYGATPQRDIIGFSAGTALAEAAQLYLRYDGEIGTMAANHTLNLGVRFTW